MDFMDSSNRARQAMPITINLSPEEERKLAERAAQSGQDPTSYVHRLITDALEVEAPAENGTGDSQETRPTLAEILAPVHEDFRKSGMTEDDLDALVEEVREEIWQEKHGSKSKAS